MSKRTKTNDMGLSRQQDLFEGGVEVGELDILFDLKQMMSRLVGDNTKDRFQVTHDMSLALNRTVSKEMLDKYTSSDMDYEIGAVKLAAFCRAVNSHAPFSLLLGPLGCEVVTAADMKYLKLARLEEQQRQIQLEIHTLRTQCGIK